MKHGPHILLASESGTGKSSFAATVIGIPPAVASGKPVLVQAFDSSDKLMPYRKRGDRIVRDGSDKEVVMLKGKEVAIIERWHEKEGRAGGGVTMGGGAKVPTMKYVNQGVMYERYLERMRDFVAEAEENYFAYIHDSTTFCQHAVASYLQGVMKVADNQLVYGQTTDELERFYLATFPDLPITTIVISHSLPQRVTTRDEKGRTRKERGTPGDVPYEIRLPGRLANDLFAAFGEIYRGYYERKEDAYYMQTRRDAVWRCQSQLEVANPLGPSPTFKDVYQIAKQYIEEE